MYILDDTIAAAASPAGGAARGIVRVSGPSTGDVVRRCFVATTSVDWPTLRVPQVIAGMAILEPLAGGDGRQIPCDLWFWPTTRSYTRSPVAEFHTLGSPPLLQALLRSVCSAGARLAEPGEFTLRAFLAGRLDLTQAEAVLGVIDAKDRRQCEAALVQLAGGLAQPLARLRESLLDLLAELEAGLDFVDEDIEFVTPAGIAQRATAAAETVEQLLQQTSLRTVSSQRFRAVLFGLPNAGKSSLFNVLAATRPALVSHLAGTTRDYLAAEVDLGEITCEIIDTAGIEPVADDPLRTSIQRLSTEQHSSAHLRLLCIDATREPSVWEWQQIAIASDDLLVVQTKIDQPRVCPPLPGAVGVSSITGEGVDHLRQRLRTAALESSDVGIVAATAIRSADSLRLASECLRRAVTTAQLGRSDELVAADLRAALFELGKVAGAVHTDDVLDRIFSRFCIGK